MLYSLYAIVLAFLGTSAARLHRHVYVSFARLCLRIGGTQLRLYGADHIQPGQAYVVVPNHESAWDPPCLVAALPQVFVRFIAKKQIMQIPIFGHALRLTGNVTVLRTQTAGDTDRIRKGMGRRDPSVSVLFFAEGTRSRDGALQAFKMGAFATALGYGLPILPVAIAGTYAVWAKGTLRLRRGPVVVEVGEEIPVEGLTLDARAALRDQTREAVVKLRARARERLRGWDFDPGGVD
jgi:1-acyl-sn-glycerol-3-phosphate acyltransferase